MPIITVALAKLSRPQPNMFDQDFQSDVLACLNPDVPVTRFRRTWRVSRTFVDGDWGSGRLGFVQQAEAGCLDYDEETNDFVPSVEEYTNGAYSNFVIHFPSEYIAFQRIGDTIKSQSFVGAFQAVLRETDPRWHVEPALDYERFADWVASVERVTHFSVTLERPNPNWDQAAESVKRLVRDTNAEEVRVRANNRDEGLNVGGSDLLEYAEWGETHGDVRADGTAAPQGRTAGGERRRFALRSNHMTDRDIVSDVQDNASVIAKMREMALGLIARHQERET